MRGECTPDASAFKNIPFSTSELGAKATLRRDFAGSLRWDDLARERGLRLPLWSVRPTRGKIGIWLKKLFISSAAYRDWFGESDFAAEGDGEQHPALRESVRAGLQRREGAGEAVILRVRHPGKAGCYLYDSHAKKTVYWLPADEARQLHEQLARYCDGICHEPVRRPLTPVAPPEEEVE